MNVRFCKALYQAYKDSPVFFTCAHLSLTRQVATALLVTPLHLPSRNCHTIVYSNGLRMGIPSSNKNAGGVLGARIANCEEYPLFSGLEQEKKKKKLHHSSHIRLIR